MGVYLLTGIRSALLLNPASLQLPRTNATIQTLRPLCLQPLLQRRITHVSRIVKTATDISVGLNAYR